MKKLYLDLCVYNRPFDDQRQRRIALETNLFIYLLGQIEEGIYDLFTSSVLEYENQKNPYPERKGKILTYLSLARRKITLTSSIVERAKFLESLGVRPIDALHIASAEEARVEYFITCDDSLLEKIKNLHSPIKVKVIGLLEFIGRDYLAEHL